MMVSRNKGSIVFGLVRSSDRFQKAVEAAIAREEIREGLQQAGFTDDYIRGEISRKADEVWRAATSQIHSFESSNDKLDTARSEIRERVTRPIRRAILALSLTSFTAACYVFLYLSPEIVLAITGKWLSETWSTNFVNLLIPLGSAVCGAASALLYFHLLRLQRRRTELQDELQLSNLVEAVRQADLEMDTSLIEKGVVPLIREIVNAELDPSYAMTLPRVSGQGLAEVFDPRYEIPTAAKDTLTHMLLTMPGGSIGVAGPRGAGKTIWMRSFCEGSTWDVKGRRVLSMMIDAPVHYDARDFVLHLFSKVCRGILKLENKDYEPDDIFLSLTQRSVTKRTLVRFGFLSTLLVLLCLLLLTVGSFLLVGALEATSDQADTATATKAATQQTAGPSSQSGMESEDGLTLSRIAEKLGLEPGALLLGVTGFLYTRLVLYRLPERELVGGSALARQAISWLQRIKFQQSFTSGWSGSLTLPIGLSSGLERGRAFARQPLSLPEIVDG